MIQYHPGFFLPVPHSSYLSTQIKSSSIDQQFLLSAFCLHIACVRCSNKVSLWDCLSWYLRFSLLCSFVLFTSLSSLFFLILIHYRITFTFTYFCPHCSSSTTCSLQLPPMWQTHAVQIKNILMSLGSLYRTSIVISIWLWGTVIRNQHSIADRSLAYHWYLERKHLDLIWSLIEQRGV